MSPDWEDMKDTALRAARFFIRQELHLFVSHHCVADLRGRPRLDTLDELAKPHVARMERLLKRITRAIEA